MNDLEKVCFSHFDGGGPVMMFFNLAIIAQKVSWVQSRYIKLVSKRHHSQVWKRGLLEFRWEYRKAGPKV
ncbi:hypothetical protein BDZ94DRAFT_1276216, partial [Collybia nuda]